jgi:hypothetical protein
MRCDEIEVSVGRAQSVCDFADRPKGLRISALSFPGVASSFGKFANVYAEAPHQLGGTHLLGARKGRGDDEFSLPVVEAGCDQDLRGGQRGAELNDGGTLSFRLRREALDLREMECDLAPSGTQALQFDLDPR